MVSTVVKRYCTGKMRQPDAVELRNHDCLVNIFDKDELCFLKYKFKHDHPFKIVFKVKWNDSQLNTSHSTHQDDSKTTLASQILAYGESTESQGSRAGAKR